MCYRSEFRLGPMVQGLQGRLTLGGGGDAGSYREGTQFPHSSFPYACAREEVHPNSLSVSQPRSEATWSPVFVLSLTLVPQSVLKPSCAIRWFCQGNLSILRLSVCMDAE